MRFKKQLISEEIGLNKTNKKTFTKGKSQKIVMSEGQLQRLMVSLKEVDELGEGAYCPGGCGGCACRHHGKFGKCDCGGIDDIWGAGKVAPGEGGDDWGPTTPQAKFKGLCRNEQDCVNMNSSGCNAKGYGDVGTCEGSGRAGDGWSRREMGEGTQPCVQDQSCAKRHYWDENKCECVAGKPPARRAPKDISKTKASNNNSNSGSGSGILPQCCYRPDGTIMYQHCNNCPTRPGFYCANCPPPVSESSSETKRELNERRYNCGCRCYMCGGTYRALVCGGTGCYSLMSFAGKDGNTVKPNADGSNVPDELKYKGEERLEGKALDNWLDNAKRGYESKHGKVSDDVGTGTDKESGENNLKEMRNLRTTQPINEAQVDKMSGWFNRLNNAGSHYNPVNLVEQPNGNSNGSNSEGHGVDDEEQDCKRCLPNGKVERKTFDFSIECPEGWVDVSEEICCPSVCCQDPNQGGNIVPANPAMGCRCSKSQTEVPCSSSSSTVGSMKWFLKLNTLII